MHKGKYPECASYRRICVLQKGMYPIKRSVLPIEGYVSTKGYVSYQKECASYRRICVLQKGMYPIKRSVLPIEGCVLRKGILSKGVYPAEVHLFYVQGCRVHCKNILLGYNICRCSLYSH